MSATRSATFRSVMLALLEPADTFDREQVRASHRCNVRISSCILQRVLPFREIIRGDVRG